MALPLTPDQLSRFENKMVEVDDAVQKYRLLVLNLKNGTGNAAAIDTQQTAITTALTAAAAIVDE